MLKVFYHALKLVANVKNNGNDYVKHAILTKKMMEQENRSVLNQYYNFEVKDTKATEVKVEIEATYGFNEVIAPLIASSPRLKNSDKISPFVNGY